MSTVYNAPVTSNEEAAALLGTATKPTAKSIAAKVAARAKAKAKAPATKPSTKDIDAKIDAALGHKAKGSKPAPAKAPAKAVKARKTFAKYDEAFCAKVRAFIKSGKTYHDAKREFGCSAHWASRMFRNSK